MHETFESYERHIKASVNGDRTTEWSRTYCYTVCSSVLGKKLIFNGVASRRCERLMGANILKISEVIYFLQIEWILRFSVFPNFQQFHPWLDEFFMPSVPFTWIDVKPEREEEYFFTNTEEHASVFRHWKVDFFLSFVSGLSLFSIQQAETYVQLFPLYPHDSLVYQAFWDV